MIAAVEWVPAGVANEHPKKYEMNAAEKDVLKMLQEQEGGGEETKTSQPEAKSKLPEVKNELPADLRMDDYSDDEVEGTALGSLLVGDEEEQDASEWEDETEKQQAIVEGSGAAEESKIERDYDDDDDMDSDDEDNLADVPDTREYMPLDVEGLEAMGLGDGGFGEANEMYGDDDSDAEDVRISKDDAVLVVAKTEEVRLVPKYSSPLTN